MLRRLEPEGCERLGAHLEPRTDHDCVSVDAVAVDQLDRGDVPVIARDEPSNPPVDDGHSGGPQRIELRVVGVDAVVEHQGAPVGQLAEQPGAAKVHGVGDDLDDALVTDLEAVAERAVDDVAPPVLGQAIDVGELVDQTGGGEHTAREHSVAAGEVEAEAVVGAAHVDDTSGDHLTAIAADLLATDGGQVRRR